MIFLFNSWFVSNLILQYIFMFLDKIFLQHIFIFLAHIFLSMYLEFQVERLFYGQKLFLFMLVCITFCMACSSLSVFFFFWYVFLAGFGKVPIMPDWFKLRRIWIGSMFQKMITLNYHKKNMLFHLFVVYYFHDCCC